MKKNFFNEPQYMFLTLVSWLFLSPQCSRTNFLKPYVWQFSNSSVHKSEAAYYRNVLPSHTSTHPCRVPQNLPSAPRGPQPTCRHTSSLQWFLDSLTLHLSTKICLRWHLKNVNIYHWNMSMYKYIDICHFIILLLSHNRFIFCPLWWTVITGFRTHDP